MRASALSRLSGVVAWAGRIGYFYFVPESSQKRIQPVSKK
jgi:hypothetical protein